MAEQPEPEQIAGTTDLIVRGGGSIAVASDALLADADRLGRVVSEAVMAHERLRVVASLANASSLGGLDFAAALAAIDAVERDARGLAVGLSLAADAYGLVERVGERILEHLAAQLAGLLGRLFPAIVLWFLPIALSAATGAVIAAFATPGGPKAAVQRAGEWLREHNELLTNPVTVALVRLVVMSADDAIVARSGMPEPVAQLIGDEGLGIVGLASSAGLLATVGSWFGVLGESRVRVEPGVSRGTTAAPVGVAERVARIPQPSDDNGGAQVRIERYPMPDGPDRFEVYIAGTVDFSLDARDEPWDMTSNVNGIAHMQTGSIDATVQAMRDAGITSTTPVTFTGYSQGGLVAATLAASGSFATAGLVMVGAPAGQVALPTGFPVIAIEHTDDIVPATGGTQRNANVVVVEREAFAGREVPPEFAVPAHQWSEYLHTAELADAAQSPRLASAVAALDRPEGPGQAVEYRAVRID